MNAYNQHENKITIMVLVELIKKRAQKMDIQVNYFLQTLSKTDAFAYYDKKADCCWSNYYPQNY